MKWPIHQMSEVADINPRDRHWKELPDDTEVTFVPMPAVSELTASIEDAELRPLGDVKKGYTYFGNDDLLFAKITPCMENGKVALTSNLANGLGFGSTEFHVIRARECVLPRYLYFFVRQPSFRRHAKQRMRGAAGQQRVPKDFLEDYPVPLPPLLEQRRIVELLDQADALRRMRREADALAERVLPALFYEMFGDPYENGKGWPTDTLERLVAEFRYGTSAKCHLDGDGLPVLRIPNVMRGEIETQELKYTELDEMEVERLLLQEGDILFVRTNGNPDYVGRCAIFDLEDDFLFASYLIRARIKNPEVNPWYVAACLRTQGGRTLLKRHIRTTAGQSNLSVSGLNEVEIPIPPKPLQDQFVARIQALKVEREKAQTSSIRLDALFQLMLQRAFSGELTAAWREAHMEELLQEMETQAKYLEEA